MTNGARLALLMFFFSYVFYLNIHNVNFFNTSRDQGVVTIKFLKKADKQLNNNGDSKKRTLILDRGGRWDIKLNF